MQSDLVSNVFAALARRAPELHWYAIADSAMQRDLPDAISTQGMSHCLFDAPEGAPVAKLAPHLVRLASPLSPDAAWRYIERYAASTQALTVLATAMEFDQLLTQLSACLEIMLPDGTEMFLAYWDPAILGALLGDAGAPSKLGVLRKEQAAKLAAGIEGWWYWNRLGELRLAPQVEAGTEPAAGMLRLTQPQVDALVDVSVPDLVLYHVELNQPHLIEDFSAPQKFMYASEAVEEAWALGLTTQWELVCYTCMKLIYKERWHADEAILKLLDQVKRKDMRFKEAVELLP